MGNTGTGHQRVALYTVVYLLQVGLEILEMCYTTRMYKLQLPVFVEVITLFFHDTVIRNIATYSKNRLIIVVMN